MHPGLVHQRQQGAVLECSKGCVSLQQSHQLAILVLYTCPAPGHLANPCMVQCIRRTDALEFTQRPGGGTHGGVVSRALAGWKWLHPLKALILHRTCAQTEVLNWKEEAELGTATTPRSNNAYNITCPNTAPSTNDARVKMRC